MRENDEITGLFRSNKVRMCSRTLSGAENLKLICVTATGINNSDLDYVKRATTSP